MNKIIEYQQVIDELSKKENLSISDYVLLIQANRNIQNFGESVKIADIATTIYGRNINILSEKSWTYETIKDYDNAKCILEEIISISNNQDISINSKIYKRFIMCLIHLGIFKQAEFVYKEAVDKYGMEDKNILPLKNIFVGSLALPKEYNGVVMLTTYPHQGSQNVGDRLITYSFFKMIKNRMGDFNPLVLWRGQSLDMYTDDSIKVVLVPGFSVCNDTYSQLFKFYTLPCRNPKIIPIGCSFQDIAPSYKSFYKHEYNDRTLSFFHEIVNAFGPIYCRNRVISDMLLSKGVESCYMGDLALYDDDYIGKKIQKDLVIENIAISVGNHEKYKYQTMQILDFIRKFYPNQQVFLTLHGKVNNHSKYIINYARNIGVEIKELFGDVDNLDFYDEMDLHIGYRLHAHIACLRKRKPSVLLVEDARSYGFSKTIDTALGCIQAYNIYNDRPSDTALQEVGDFLEWSFSIGFSNYNAMFDKIDINFKNIVEPLLYDIIKVLENKN